MLFKRKKTKQEHFLDELYWDSIILKEMIDSYKKDRQKLLNLLRDRVRHTKPNVTHTHITSSAEFDGLHIFWYWCHGEIQIRARYEDNDLPKGIAEDLYSLYRIVWCDDVYIKGDKDDV